MKNTFIFILLVLSSQLVHQRTYAEVQEHNLVQDEIKNCKQIYRQTPKLDCSKARSKSDKDLCVKLDELMAKNLARAKDLDKEYLEISSARNEVKQKVQSRLEKEALEALQPSFDSPPSIQRGKSGIYENFIEQIIGNPKRYKDFDTFYQGQITSIESNFNNTNSANETKVKRYLAKRLVNFSMFFQLRCLNEKMHFENYSTESNTKMKKSTGKH